jgi:polyhydroxyalkanoate synthesis regulator phasin
MTDAPQPLPDEPFDRLVMGGNNPPEPLEVERVAELIPTCDDWTKKGELTSDHEARVLSEFLVQIRKARDLVKAGSPEDRQPHLDALAEIRATVAHLMEPHEKALEAIGAQCTTLLPKLDIAIERIAGSRRVTGLLADWMAKKNRQLEEEAAAKRREAEEAERAAQRAVDRSAVSGTIDDEVAAQQAVEEADAAAKAVRRAPTRASVKGDLAPKAVSLTTYWEAKITDWKLAGRHYKGEERVINAFRDAVQMVANADARRLKDPKLAPPGVEFVSREQAK